jgi:hypothetical protein
MCICGEYSAGFSVLIAGMTRWQSRGYLPRNEPDCVSGILDAFDGVIISIG